MNRELTSIVANQYHSVSEVAHRIWFTSQAALLCLSLVLFGSVSHVQAAITVYDFANNLTIQNGYTIYGEIVTDGLIGALSSNDIQTTPNSSAGAQTAYAATSLAIYNPSASFPGSPTPLPAYFVQFNGLYADADGNLWAADSVGISTYDESFGISYYGTLGVGTSYEHGDSSGPYLWTTSGNGLSGWVLIATEAPSDSSSTPEPATLTIWALGFVGVVYLRRRRQRLGGP